MSRNARLALIVVALILAVSGFILRATGIDTGADWWEVVIPGVVAAAMVYLLLSEVRRQR